MADTTQEDWLRYGKTKKPEKEQTPEERQHAQKAWEAHVERCEAAAQEAGRPPTEAEIDAQWKNEKLKRTQEIAAMLKSRTLTPLEAAKQQQADRLARIAHGAEAPTQHRGIDRDDDRW